MIELDGKLDKLLDSIVVLGLHGNDRDTVAKAMLVRGIEAIFPLIKQGK